MTANVDTGAYVQELACMAADKTPIYEEKRSHCKIAALLLQPIQKNALEAQDNVRVSFVVTQCLQAGFSCGNYNIDKKPAAGTKRDPKDYIYQWNAETGGILMKSYEHITKGNKGAVTETGALVQPGMVMQTMVFKDQFAGIFGPVDEKEMAVTDSLDKALPHIEDMPAFSRVVIVLASRSSGAKATQNGNLVQIKRVKQCEGPFVFGSSSLLQAGLFSSTLDESLSKRVAFTDSEALRAASGLQAVDQSYIQNVLSQTRHVLRVPPNELRGDVGRNADGTMYISLTGGTERFGFEVSRVRLHDPFGYMASLGDADWVENLLRFALAGGALTLFFTYDSMRAGMAPGEEQFLDGFCMIDVRAMLSMCIMESPVPQDQVPEALREAFYPPKTEAGEFDVFVEEGWAEEHDSMDDAVFAVISKKMCKRREDLVVEAGMDGPAWWPVLCHPKQATLWREGRMVRVFRRGKLALFFVLSSHAMPAGASKKRCFNELDDDGLADYL